MTFDQMPSYPIAIQKAIMAVHYLDFFRQFTGATKSILMEIVIRLDQFDAQKPIWFKRVNVAAKLQYDRKTVYNALKKLEDTGLILREVQATDSYGYFTCAKIFITKKLAELTGLPWEPSNRGEKTESPTYNCNINLKKQPERQPCSKDEKKPGLFDDPALKFLKDAGLTNSAIFLLMKICKTASQRLSDVINYIGDRLREIKTPRELFAYLKRCIEADKDYGFMLQRKNEEVKKENEKIEQDVKRKERMEAFTRDYAGKTFESVRTGAKIIYDQGGWGYNPVTGGFLSPYELFTAFTDGVLVLLNGDSGAKKPDFMHA